MSQQKKVLLAVLAHPDDETFGTGGTLALYARQGVEVHLVCATRGEVGDVDPQYMAGFSSVADVRVSELRCAAGILGLAGVHFLDYRDSGMPGSSNNHHPNSLASAPLDEVAAKVAHYYNLLQPQVVITFDPIGGYRHPDHIAIQKATTLAFDAAHNGHQRYPDPQSLPSFAPQKLYYQTIPRTYMRIAISLMKVLGRDPHRFGRNNDVDIASIAEVSFPINARVNFRPVAELREQAAACHASQGGQQPRRNLVSWVRFLAFKNETYMRAYPPVDDGYVEKDLFEGID